MSSRTKALTVYADLLGRDFPSTRPDELAASELAAAKAIVRRMSRELDTLAEHLGRVERALATKFQATP